MTKEELIARLKELSVLLSREVNLTGTKEELSLRVTELEEELDDGGDGLQGDALNHLDSHGDVAGGEETKGQLTADNASNTHLNSGELVLVETLVTLHIDALHATKNELVQIAEPGVLVRVSPGDAELLTAQKLVLRH